MLWRVGLAAFGFRAVAMLDADSLFTESEAKASVSRQDGSLLELSTQESCIGRKGETWRVAQDVGSGWRFDNSAVDLLWHPRVVPAFPAIVVSV